jgi:phytol kinase
MTLAGVVLLFLTLCGAVELVKRRCSFAPEVLRKLVHIPAAVVTAALPLVLSFQQIAFLGLLFGGLMALSRRAQIFSAIHGVERTTYGEILFPLGIAVLALLPVGKVGFAFGVLVLGLGDGLAALVGIRLGRRRVPLLATRKTLWGSGTFLAVVFVLAAGFLLATRVAPVHALVAAAAIAFALTPAELLLVGGLDNLLLPVLAGLLLAAS